jgi:hypothetical protein
VGCSVRRGLDTLRKPSVREQNIVASAIQICRAVCLLAAYSPSPTADALLVHLMILLPWGAHGCYRKTTTGWEGGCDTLLQQGRPVVHVHYGRGGDTPFIVRLSRWEGLKAVGDRKASNRRREVLVRAARAEALRALQAGESLYFSPGQEGGTFEVRSQEGIGRASARGVCRTLGIEPPQEEGWFCDPLVAPPLLGEEEDHPRVRRGPLPGSGLGRRAA